MSDIEKILEMKNLSKKQKSVLLENIANELIKKKENVQEDPMAKHDMVAEENRKHTEELKERIKGYEEKRRKEEKERLRNLSPEEKIAKLATLKNRGGEPLYTEKDLNSLTGFEIESLFDAVFNKDNKQNTEGLNTLDNNESGLETAKEQEENKPEEEKQNEENRSDNVDEHDDEIVSERESSPIFKSEKFKRIAKKALKIGAIAGGIGLIAGAIYNFTKGDTETLSNIISKTSETIIDASNSVNGLDSATIDYDTIYSSANDAFLGTGGMEANEWARNTIVQAANSEGNIQPAHTIQDVINLKNNGFEVQSVAVGDSYTSGNVSGFVDADSVINAGGGVK